MKKQLPPGDWITFVGLTLQTTDEEFQTFLADCGLNVPVEHISISAGQSGRSAGAIISLSREDVCNLVHRALLDENGQTKTLNGREVIPQVPHGKLQDAANRAAYKDRQSR